MSKHKWSIQEDTICVIGYKLGKKPIDINNLLPHLSISSIRCKYGNCKHLDKKTSGFSHFSKQNQKAWHNHEKMSIKDLNKKWDELKSKIINKIQDSNDISDVDECLL